MLLYNNSESPEAYREKRTDDPKEDPKIVYKDNFRTSFEMTMLLLVYVVVILVIA